MTNCVLILGANGFIGRHLAEDFAARGIRVIAATRTPALFSHVGIENAVSPFSSKEDFLPLLEKCDSVVHAASSSTPSSSATQPQLEGNLRATLALIEALQDFSRHRLVYLSSGGTLYGDSGQPINEDAPLRPRSYHAAGKIASEGFIRAWAAQHEGTAVILRPSNVYGQGQMPKAGFGIIPTAFDCAMHGLPISIFGDGSTVRDYLHIGDFADLCCYALKIDLPAGTHVYNASSGIGTPLNALLDAICNVTQLPLKRIYQSARTVDIHSVVLDNRRATAAFGWMPNIGINSGLISTWNWFQTIA